MKARIHAVAGTLALVLVAAFWWSSLVSELFLSAEAVVAVKRAIVYGIVFLIPMLMVAGGSGFALSRARKGNLVATKKVRMRFIALNGLLVLAPSAVFLHGKAAAGQFDLAFIVVQTVELVAGAAQMTLLVWNLRDGLRLSGRLRKHAARTAA